MKKNLFLFIIAAVLVTNCQQTPEQVPIDIETEKEAIIAVIEQEFDAYNARDLNQQSKFYLQDESIMMQYSGEGSYGIGFGWKEIKEGYERFYAIKSNPESNKSKLENYHVKIYEKSAWASYDELWYDTDGQYIWKNVNVKFFEKVEGEWKIVFLSQLTNVE